MKKTFVRLYAAAFLAIFLTVFSVPATAQAAKKSITAGKTITLNAKKKASWKVSNRKVAQIKVTGKGRKAKVTGLKAGKTRIVAKAGRKKITWKITVKGTAKVAGAAREVSTPVAGSSDRVFHIDTGATTRGRYDDNLAGQLMTATNTYRKAKGMKALKIDSTLIAAARVRAYEAAVKWGHTRPNGTPYYTVDEDAVYGENLAYGYTTSSEAMTAWEKSSGHNANLLRGTFTKVGIAVVSIRTENGTYVNYIAQEFGM